MRDDFIQGIIFSRSNLVDLRRMTRSERTMYKLLATKRTLRDWSSQQAKHMPYRRTAPSNSLLPGKVIKPSTLAQRLRDTK
jgi:hypothetical protein